MSCDNPVAAFKKPGGGITFNRKEGYIDLPTKIPCGYCLGCRLDRTQQWAARCVHEAQLHVDKCFITLTYRDDALPRGGVLCLDHFQKFMKRLRKSMPFDGPRGERSEPTQRKISFFHCGEYGPELGRPHYHALIFGYDFTDRTLWKKSPQGDLYVSPTLERLWGHGFTTVGALTYESAAYTARYIMKKVAGDRAEAHYTRLLSDGTIISLPPEYCTMSRRPAIGRAWIAKYHGEVFPDDFIVARGVKVRVPKYYDRYLEEFHPEAHAKIKLRRIAQQSTADAKAEQTPPRLKVRAEVKAAKVNLNKRKLG